MTNNVSKKKKMKKNLDLNMMSMIKQFDMNDLSKT